MLALFVSLIIGLVLIGLAFWVVRTLSEAFGFPKQITAVIYVVLVVAVVVWLLHFVDGAAFGRLLR